MSGFEDYLRSNIIKIFLSRIYHQRKQATDNTNEVKYTANVLSVDFNLLFCCASL